MVSLADRRHSSPVSSTMPAPSWPSTTGSGFGVAPEITFQSEWQTPLAASRMLTSPGPGECEVEILDREGLVDGLEDGSSHRAIVCRSCL